MRRILATVVVILVVMVVLKPSWSQSEDKMSLIDRLMIASRIYHQVSTFFPDLSQESFDRDYAEYLKLVSGGSDDRREFDLASMALLASLHDGHTWFYDNWLDQAYGGPVGFSAYPLQGQWVVVRSSRATLHPGDIIEAVDGTPTQQYFERNRKYVSGSSDRDAGTSFFDTPVLFPQRFTLTLDGGRRVTIDRSQHLPAAASPETEGRWLVPQSVGYIKIPSFQGIENQAAALHFLRQFHEAKAVIVDVRGNPGGGLGVNLQQSLMGKPYPLWTEASAMKGGVLLRNYSAYPESSQITSHEAVMQPGGPVYTGRLIVLVDRVCSCGCEDFVMPFKVTKRAQLVGETTAGTFSLTNRTQFDNGMMLNVSSIRHTFPDGSRFEGVGITPDVEIEPTPQDLKAGRDIVLKRATEMAERE